MINFKEHVESLKTINYNDILKLIQNLQEFIF